MLQILRVGREAYTGPGGLPGDTFYLESPLALAHLQI